MGYGFFFLQKVEEDEGVHQRETKGNLIKTHLPIFPETKKNLV